MHVAGGACGLAAARERTVADAALLLAACVPAAVLPTLPPSAPCQSLATPPTSALFVSRLTLASSTPSAPLSAASTAAEQEEQTMPPTASCSVAAAPLPRGEQPKPASSIACFR